MQPVESQILSFRPFLGALLFKGILSVCGAPSLLTEPKHQPGVNCCPLHKAAALPGGDDAQWMLDYTPQITRELLPEIGTDSRIDLWELWTEREEWKRRLFASANAGNVHAIDSVHSKFWEVERGDFGFQEDAVVFAQKSYAEYWLMSTDKLELLAFRGSKLATETLVRRLSNPRRCNDVGRHVFWSFIYCAVHGKNLTGLSERPALSSLVARFQLGKCFADAPEEFDVTFAATRMCVDPFTPCIVQLAQEKIRLFITDYKEAEEKARTAIDLWSCGMMKRGLIYDVRYLIVKILWDARWTWTREWTTHKFFQKRAKTPAATTE